MSRREHRVRRRTVSVAEILIGLGFVGFLTYLLAPGTSAAFFGFLKSMPWN